MGDSCVGAPTCDEGTRAGGGFSEAGRGRMKQKKRKVFPGDPRRKRRKLIWWPPAFHSPVPVSCEAFLVLSECAPK